MTITTRSGKILPEPAPASIEQEKYVNFESRARANDEVEQVVFIDSKDM